MRLSAYLASRRDSRTDATPGQTPPPAEPPHILRQHFALSTRDVEIEPLTGAPTDTGKPSFPVWSVAPMEFDSTRVDPHTPGSMSPGEHLDELSPAQAAQQAVLYVLPGGFATPIQERNWKFIGVLAEAGLRVDIPLYGLIPKCSVAQGLPLIRECYRQLVADHGAENVTIIGDSAGGGLALSALARPLENTNATSTAHATSTANPPDTAAEKLPAPKALVLNAPWLDMDLSNPDAEKILPNDPLLDPTTLRPQGVQWASGLVTAGICTDANATEHPAVSPLSLSAEQLREALTGTRPTQTYIYCGTRDISLPDCAKLASKIKEAGLSATFHEEEGAIHMYHLTNTPEGKAARKRMIEIATT